MCICTVSVGENESCGEVANPVVGCELGRRHLTDNRRQEVKKRPEESSKSQSRYQAARTQMNSKQAERILAVAERRARFFTTAVEISAVPLDVCVPTTLRWELN